MAFDCDRDAIWTALGMIGLTLRAQARVVRIKNTLHLTEMDASEALLPEIKMNPRLDVIGEPSPFFFDHCGNLGPFW